MPHTGHLPGFMLALPSHSIGQIYAICPVWAAAEVSAAASVWAGAVASAAGCSLVEEEQEETVTRAVRAKAQDKKVFFMSKSKRYAEARFWPVYRKTGQKRASR
jgi:hypothetical protein